MFCPLLSPPDLSREFCKSRFAQRRARRGVRSRGQAHCPDQERRNSSDIRRCRSSWQRSVNPTRASSRPAASTDRLLRGAFTRSALSGWSTTLAVEKAALDAPLWRSLWMFGGGGAVLVAGALLFALYYARGIARPLVALAGMAAALGRGEHIPAQHLNLREAQAVADQMHIAAAALEQRAREVDHLNASSNSAQRRERRRTGGSEPGIGGLFLFDIARAARAPPSYRRILRRSCLTSIPRPSTARESVWLVCCGRARTH